MSTVDSNIAHPSATAEERQIEYLLERDIVPAAIVALSTYKGMRDDLYQQAYRACFRHGMVYELVQVYRSRHDPRFPPPPETIRDLVHYMLGAFTEESDLPMKERHFTPDVVRGVLDMLVYRGEIGHFVQTYEDISILTDADAQLRPDDQTLAEAIRLAEQIGDRYLRGRIETIFGR